MPSASLIALFACAVAVIAVLVALWRLRPGVTVADQALVERLAALEADAVAAREAKATLEKDLAVEQQRSSRVADLEERLRQKEGQFDKEREAAGAAKEDLAAAQEAQTHLRAAAEALRKRLEELEAARIEDAASLESFRKVKGSLEAALSDHTARLEEKEQNYKVAEQERLDTMKAFSEAKNEAAQLKTKLSVAESEREQARAQAEEKLRLMTEVRESLPKEFNALANEVMLRHGDAFAKQNKEQIDVVLQPLREKLTEFHQGLQAAQTESAKERAALGEQIRHLSEDSARMSRETSSLTQALRGEAQTQGAWGEMILASILERSGLREGAEYQAQETHVTEDGDRLRPDVIVRLPGQRRLIIDSKVSLVAFDAYVNAAAEEDREEHLKHHLASMRAHIRNLSGKQYQSLGPIDYVVMFVPIEGALAAALQREPELTSFAVASNVAIATPTTLMIALRTAEAVWQVERRNTNAEQIADRAGKMYDKFVNFITDLNLLGKRLTEAQQAWQGAMGKLSSGQGNLAGQFEKMKELGARTAKAIPPALLGNDPDESESAPGAAE